MKRRIASIFLAGAGMVFAYSAQSSVIISEIMHHPQSDNNAEQWFELYNTEDSSVDLSGWVVSEGCNFVFPAGTKIGARDNIVVAANTEISVHYILRQIQSSGTGPGVSELISA
jgi:hypothetical protein